jgi:hypothetical protein
MRGQKAGIPSRHPCSFLPIPASAVTWFQRLAGRPSPQAYVLATSESEQYGLNFQARLSISYPLPGISWPFIPGLYSRSIGRGIAPSTAVLATLQARP